MESDKRELVTPTITRAMFDQRVEQLQYVPEPRFASIRAKLYWPLTLAVPFAVGGMFLAVDRFGWIRSYLDVMYGMVAIIGGGVLLVLVPFMLQMLRRARHARKLGLHCPSCDAMLALPIGESGEDPIADEVRDTGECPRCGCTVLAGVNQDDRSATIAQ